MKNLIVVLLIFAGFIANAQDKSEDTFVTFSSTKKTVDGMFASNVFPFSKTKEFSFAFISAYAEGENVDIKLSFQITSHGKKREKMDFKVDNHGQSLGRTAFVATTVLDDFESIQFFSNKASSLPIYFRLFMPKTRGSQTISTHLTTNNLGGCSCPQPTFCGRDCWCNTCPADATPTPTTPTHIIVHHSGGNNTSSDYAAVVASYWDYHVNTRGWDDIGYNWLIDPNGVIYEGRGDGVRGAHFSCMNSNTTGICVVGNYEDVEPSAAALTSLQSLIAWESCDKGFLPNTQSLHVNSELNLYHVSGHRDGNSSPSASSCASGTVCPGENLYIKLENIRENAAAFSCLSSVYNMHSPALFSISPNPSNGIFNINFTSKNTPTDLSVTGIDGKEMYFLSLNKNDNKSQSLNLENLAKGVYFLKINYKNGASQVRKIVLK